MICLPLDRVTIISVFEDRITLVSAEEMTAMQNAWPSWNCTAHVRYVPLPVGDAVKLEGRSSFFGHPALSFLNSARRLSTKVKSIAH
jgi:hypothetical protein